jgi:hypothetical protein
MMLAACNPDAATVAPHVNDLPVLNWTEEVRVGSVDDPVAGFSQIRRVRASDNGNVYALEASGPEVRVFDASGEPLRVIGGRGQGPGEFQLPTEMGLLGDTLWVSDLITRRITWFSLDGDVLFTTPMTRVEVDSGLQDVALTVAPMSPRPDGLIDSDYSIAVTPNREFGAFQYPVLLFNREGEVVDTLRWATFQETQSTYQVGGSRGYAPALFPMRPIATKVSGGALVVDWSVPAGSNDGLMNITWIDENQDTTYVRDLRYEPIPVPESVMDSLVAPRLEFAVSREVSEGELDRALRDAIQLPDFRPPVRLVHAGADGSAWLRLNTASTEVATWVLIFPSRDHIGLVSLPPRTRIQHSAFPTVWAVAEDELEIPWLVRISLDR